MNLRHTLYWQEIRDLADTVLKEDEQLWYDTAMELVDNHQYVIYTFYSLRVLCYTDNLHAWRDLDADLNAVHCPVAAMAYSAMLTDVMDRVHMLNTRDVWTRVE